MELLCPAGNLPALKAAIENGADAVLYRAKR
ncbi:protease yhbU [Escherichia coli]|uniref:Protease yhbU n=1 Tax=Escherichia coli TaxID=562 RepID=A0A484YNQ9_ECOLX|nr:protease yhbU [Escherichia coli]